MLNRFTVHSRGPNQEVKETPALQSSVMETDQSWSVETCVGLSVAMMEVQPPRLHFYIHKMQMNGITCFGDCQRRPRSAHGLTPVLSSCSLCLLLCGGSSGSQSPRRPCGLLMRQSYSPGTNPFSCWVSTATVASSHTLAPGPGISGDLPGLASGFVCSRP